MKQVIAVASCQRYSCGRGKLCATYPIRENICVWVYGIFCFRYMSLTYEYYAFLYASFTLRCYAPKQGIALNDSLGEADSKDGNILKIWNVRTTYRGARRSAALDF
jgi:hypothetical protein